MIYSVKQIAQMFGVSEATVRMWDKDNKLKAERDFGNRRYYTQEMIDVFLKNYPQYKQNKAMEQEKENNVNSSNVGIVVLVDIKDEEKKEKEKKVKEKYLNYIVHYINNIEDLYAFIEILVVINKNIKEIVLNKDFNTRGFFLKALLNELKDFVLKGTFDIRGFSLMEMLYEVRNSVKFNIVLDKNI